MNQDKEQMEQEIDWDTPIGPEVEQSEFAVLPDGTECAFEVKKLEKDRSQAGSPMAKIELICTADDGRRAYVHENLTLSPKALFRVRQFGVAIGHIPPNLAAVVNWDDIETNGATGRCVLTVEEWTRRSGEKTESNKVKMYLAPVVEFDGPNHDAPADAPPMGGESEVSFG
jgi:hypothetical protein